MKVLHVINSLAMGGAEKLIAETVPRLRSAGLEVEVLLLNGTETKLVSDLKADGIEVHSLGNGSVYHPKHIFGIMPYLQRFDIIHVHLFPAQYFAAAAKMLSPSRVKLIFTEHNTTNRRIENAWFKIPEKLIYAQYDKIIAITEEVKQALKNHIGLPESKIEVLENGIDTRKFSEAAPLQRSAIAEGISDDDFLITQVSGFRPQKDQATVVKAMMHLPKNVKLLLVGQGVTLDTVKQIAKEAGVADRVLFLGIRHDIPNLLKASDVVLLSSHYEGLSLASLEGMASGRPFIGSAVPGIKDLVEGYGILFPQGDAEALAQEITRLLEDRGYYEAVAGLCTDRAKAYDISKMVDKTVKLYRSLVVK